MIGRLLGVGATLALAGAALAQTVTQSNSIPYTDTNYTQPLVLPQFDPSQGTLTSVDISFTGSVQTTIKIENKDSSSKSYTANAADSLELDGTSGAALLTVKPTLSYAGQTLAAYDGTADFAGTSGVTLTKTSSDSGMTTLTSAADLAQFVGAGNVSLPVNANANATITASGNSNKLILTQAAASITVVYHYTPYALGSLGDRVFFDANNNGIQDANEKGISGVAVALVDANGNVLKVTKTDASGYYLFQGLQAGDYRVQFGKPDGYAYSFTKQNAGNDATLDSDASPTGLTGLVHLDSGQNRLDVDAGLVGTLCVGDRVWKDYNGNGFQDCDEPGFPGVPVHLRDANGNDLADTVTDACGNYKFCNVAAGNYTVDFDAPTGYGFTKQYAKYNNVNYPAYDSNADLVNGYAPVSLTSNDMTIDAGLVGGLKIGDQVWLDSDGDGKFDVAQGEKGIPNVRVVLFGYISGGWYPDVVLTTTTDANGKYLFNGLYPGTYVVATNPVDLNGLTETYDLDGLGSQNYAVLKLVNADNLDVDFGYKLKSSCGGASHCWWQCNLPCWPTSCLQIGNQCHTMPQMCGWFKIGSCFDQSICLYQRLCAAKLNVGYGCDHSKVYTCGNTTCSVKTAIQCCDAWMAKHPVGCNVSPYCADWASIKDCYSILDKFCSGN